MKIDQHDYTLVHK